MLSLSRPLQASPVLARDRGSHVPPGPLQEGGEQGMVNLCHTPIPGIARREANPATAHHAPAGDLQLFSWSFGVNIWQDLMKLQIINDFHTTFTAKGHFPQLFLFQQRHQQPFLEIPRAQLRWLHPIGKIQISSFPSFPLFCIFSSQTMKETDGS